MATYALYLESGPQHKTTMAHVLSLPGATSFARTTAEVVAAAPDAIRAYLRYLGRHGEAIDRSAEIEVRIAEHVTEGSFVGTMFFAPDLAPVKPAELARWATWREWSRADLLRLVSTLDARTLAKKPGAGRTIAEILAHVLESDKAYLYSILGTTKSVGDPVNAALKGTLDVLTALRYEGAAAVARLRALTPAERGVVKGTGLTTQTTRRAIRRMLEHEWEHRREIAARLGVEP